VPLDVPHRAQIMRLCSADSNALEAVYRERKDELEAAWWQACQAVAAPARSLENIQYYCCVVVGQLSDASRPNLSATPGFSSVTARQPSPE
jgi:hypothetical protein